MAETFGGVWNAMRLHVPDAPALLVRAWVQQAYAQITDARPWSWTLQAGQMTWGAARSFDVTATTGSATVTSAALFLATDVGRQFRVGTYPIYQIASISTDLITATLTEPYYGMTSGAVTGQVLNAYATLPADFGTFTAVVDPVNQRWIPWWATQQEIDLLDPVRMATDSVPRLLAALALSPVTATDGRPQFEYWPKPTAAGALQYYARLRPAELADSAVFKGPLAHRGDVVRTGALAQAAKWPGTRDRPNPYFNLALARQLDGDFVTAINQLDLRDDDLYQQSVDKVPWQRWNLWTWAYNTRLLQMSDATLGDYAGGGWYPSGSGW